MAAFTCILLVLSVLIISQRDPYVVETLKLTGSEESGAQLFRINCAGCHGISAQGLVGPKLRGISDRKRDSKLIKQIISGQTPPMPSFEMDTQSMSDILAHLHSLSN